jgi:peptide/nickel transport system substrate-binding protein
MAGSAAALATPSIAAAQGQRVLKFVPHADLTVLDPSWSASYITRNAAIMVCDMLYGVDSDFKVHPQMAAGHQVEEGGKVWTITLRPEGAVGRDSDTTVTIRPHRSSADAVGVSTHGA